MTRFFLPLFLLLMAVSAAPSHAQSNAPITYVEQGAALSGYDPVAYFTLGQPVPGKPEFKLVWKRAEWRFVSREHRDLFEANPRAYAPQYGGYCAYGVSKGHLSTTKPDVWMIHQGRLYLVHNRAVLAVWQHDVPGHVDQANDHWPQLLRK